MLMYLVVNSLKCYESTFLNGKPINPTFTHFLQKVFSYFCKMPASVTCKRLVRNGRRILLLLLSKLSKAIPLDIIGKPMGCY